MVASALHGIHSDPAANEITSRSYVGTITRSSRDARRLSYSLRLFLRIPWGGEVRGICETPSPERQTTNPKPFTLAAEAPNTY